MDLDIGDVAGIVAGTAVAGVVANETRKALKDGRTSDDPVSDLLAIGAGLLVGGAVGAGVDSLFDGLFGD